MNIVYIVHNCNSNSNQGQWKYAGNFISIFILAALFLLSLVGLTLISRVSILFTFLSLSSVFTLSGELSIDNLHSHSPIKSILPNIQNGSELLVSNISIFSIFSHP